jgi:hypothetical protein
MILHDLLGKIQSWKDQEEFEEEFEEETQGREGTWA